MSALISTPQHDICQDSKKKDFFLLIKCINAFGLWIHLNVINPFVVHHLFYASMNAYYPSPIVMQQSSLYVRGFVQADTT